MPKCSKCSHDLTIFDKDLCPFCGQPQPFDENQKVEGDTTQFVDNVESIKEAKLYKRKKLSTYCILMSTLGIFAAHLFYIKSTMKAIYLLFANLAFIGGSGYLLSLLLFKTDLIFLNWIIAFGGLFFVYIILAIFTKFKGDVLDQSGQKLK